MLFQYLLHCYWRNERDHRLWPILSPPSSPRYMWDPFFTDTYLLNILTQKCHFSDTQIRRKWTLFQTCLCLSNTLSWDLWTAASLFHNGHKRTFKWSYRWNHELKVQTCIKQISCDTKSICFNPFIRHYNTLRWGRERVVPESWLSPWETWLHPLRRQEVCVPFHTIGTVYSERSCVNNWLSSLLLKKLIWVLLPLMLVCLFSVLCSFLLSSYQSLLIFYWDSWPDLLNLSLDWTLDEVFWRWKYILSTMCSALLYYLLVHAPHRWCHPCFLSVPF